MVSEELTNELSWSFCSASLPLLLLVLSSIARLGGSYSSSHRMNNYPGPFASWLHLLSCGLSYLLVGYVLSFLRDICSVVSNYRLALILQLITLGY